MLSAKELLMKKNLLPYIVTISMLITLPSCTTTYDAHGRPVQSVDPGAAAMGAAAAGVAGYAIGRSSRDDRRYHRGYRHRHSYWR
jgi:hypothetical protein